MSNINRIGEPIQLRENGKFYPNVNALYGPYDSFDDAAEAILLLFKDFRNAPRGLTAAVDDNGQLKEYWIDNNQLILKTNGTSDSGSGTTVTTTAYSVTLDNNDIIVLDDDSSAEIVSSQFTTLRVFDGQTNITSEDNIQIDFPDNFPFNITPIDIQENNYIKYQLTLKSNQTGPIPVGSYLVTYNAQVGEFNIPKTQRIIVKDFSDGEIYQIIANPNTLAKNADGSLLYSDDNKIKVNLKKVSPKSSEFCTLDQNTYLLCKIKTETQDLTILNSTSNNASLNGSTSRIVNNTDWIISFEDSDIEDTLWITIEAYTKYNNTATLVDSETIDFRYQGEIGYTEITKQEVLYKSSNTQPAISDYPRNLQKLLSEFTEQEKNGWSETYPTDDGTTHVWEASRTLSYMRETTTSNTIPDTQFWTDWVVIRKTGAPGIALSIYGAVYSKAENPTKPIGTLSDYQPYSYQSNPTWYTNMIEGTIWMSVYDGSNFSDPIKISGKDGIGISITGSVDSIEDLEFIENPSVGDTYILNGHLYTYCGEERGWEDMGQFKGDPASPLYAHIKYSIDGQTEFTGNDGEDIGDYIGFYFDNNQTDPSTTDVPISAYKWYYAKGKRGPAGADGTDYEYVYIRIPSTFNFDSNDVFEEVKTDEQITAYVAHVNHWSVTEENFKAEHVQDAPDYKPMYKVYKQSSQENFIYVQSTDNPQGVDENYKLEFVAARSSYNTTENGEIVKHWNQFSTPTLWSNFGEKGQDGVGLEYIYIKLGSNVESVSEYALSKLNERWEPIIRQDNSVIYAGDYCTDDAVPDMYWTDEPPSMTEQGQKVFHSIRKKKYLESDDIPTGVEHPENYIGKFGWTKFSTPKLWAYYSKDAESAYSIDFNGNDTIIVDNNSTNDSDLKAATITCPGIICEGVRESNIPRLNTNKWNIAFSGLNATLLNNNFEIKFGNSSGEENKENTYLWLALKQGYSDPLPLISGKISYTVQYNDKSLTAEQNIIISDISAGETYNVITSPNQIRYESNGYFSNDSIDITVFENFKGQRTDITSNQSKCSIYCSFDQDFQNPTLVSNGTFSIDQTIKNYILNPNNDKTLHFRIYNANNQLIDETSILFIKDGEDADSSISLQIDNDVVIVDDDTTALNCRIATRVNPTILEGKLDITSGKTINVQLSSELQNYFYIGTYDSSTQTYTNSSGTQLNVTLPKEVYIYPNNQATLRDKLSGYVIFKYIQGGVTYAKSQSINVKNISNGVSYKLVVYPNIIKQRTPTNVTVELIKIDSEGTAQVVPISASTGFCLSRASVNNQSSQTFIYPNNGDLYTESLNISSDVGVIYTALKGTSEPGIQNGDFIPMGRWTKSNYSYPYATTIPVKNNDTIVSYAPVYADSEVLTNEQLQNTYINFSDGYVMYQDVHINNIYYKKGPYFYNDISEDLASSEYITGFDYSLYEGAEQLTYHLNNPVPIDKETVGVAVAGDPGDSGNQIIFDKDTLIIDNDSTQFQNIDIHAYLLHNGQIVTDNYTVTFGITYSTNNYFHVTSEGNKFNIKLNNGVTTPIPKGSGYVTVTYEYNNQTFSKDFQFLVQDFSTGEMYTVSITPGYVVYNPNDKTYSNPLGLNYYTIDAFTHTRDGIEQFRETENLKLKAGWYVTENGVQVLKPSEDSFAVDINTGLYSNPTLNLSNYVNRPGLGAGIYDTVNNKFLCFDIIDKVTNGEDGQQGDKGDDAYTITIDNDTAVIDNDVNQDNVHTATAINFKVLLGKTNITTSVQSAYASGIIPSGLILQRYYDNSWNKATTSYKPCYKYRLTGTTGAKLSIGTYTITFTLKHESTVIGTKTFVLQVKDITPDGVNYKLFIENDSLTYNAEGNVLVTGSNYADTVLHVQKIVNGTPEEQTDVSRITNLNSITTDGFYIHDPFDVLEKTGTNVIRLKQVPTYKAEGYIFNLYYKNTLVDSEKIDCTKDWDDKINSTNNSITSLNNKINGIYTYYYDGDFDSTKTYRVDSNKRVPYISIPTVVNPDQTASGWSFIATTSSDLYLLNFNINNNVITNVAPNNSNTTSSLDDTTPGKYWIKMGTTSNSIEVFNEAIFNKIQSNIVVTNNLIIKDQQGNTIAGMQGEEGFDASNPLIWAGSKYGGNSNEIDINSSSFRVYSNGKVVCNQLQTSSWSVGQDSVNPEYYSIGTNDYHPFRYLRTSDQGGIKGDIFGSPTQAIKPNTLGKLLLIGDNVSNKNIHLPSFRVFIGGDSNKVSNNTKNNNNNIITIDVPGIVLGYQDDISTFVADNGTMSEKLRKWMAYCRQVVGNKLTIINVNPNQQYSNGWIIGYTSNNDITDGVFVSDSNNIEFYITDQSTDDIASVLLQEATCFNYNTCIIELECCHYVKDPIVITNNTYEPNYEEIVYWKVNNYAQIYNTDIQSIFKYNIANQDQIQSIFDTPSNS